MVKLLVDIVSKNGNMLLSVPLRADGTFDEKEEQILKEFGAWMKVNKESIIGTRPWKVFGEGPIAEQTIALRAQGFNDGNYAKADARDIRFTQTSKYIYVTALGWPEDHQIVIRSLGRNSKLHPGGVSRVELLGYGKLKCKRTAEGLVVTLPDVPTNGIAPVLRIRK